MNVIRIGCDLSNQCYNYKTKCGDCSGNWELPWEEREECEDFSQDEYEE